MARVVNDLRERGAALIDVAPTEKVRPCQLPLAASAQLPRSVCAQLPFSVLSLLRRRLPTSVCGSWRTPALPRRPRQCALADGWRRAGLRLRRAAPSRLDIPYPGRISRIPAGYVYVYICIRMYTYTYLFVSRIPAGYAWG